MTDKRPFRRWLFRSFRKNETEIHELNYLFWECTWRCNLSCRHCGSDCKAAAAVADMPFQDFLKALEPLEKRYPRDTTIIAITGGEPLSRQDLADCGRQLRQHGFRWGIVTNGMLYDEARHRELVAAGLSSITVSLDGLEETHNWLRQHPQSFQRALRALRLIANDPRLIYDVVTCVHGRNLKELPQLKELLIANGIRHWRMFTIAPIGRAAGDRDLMLSRAQVEEMLQFIADTRKEGRVDLKFSCEAYTGKYEEEVRDSYFFCRAATSPPARTLTARYDRATSMRTTCWMSGTIASKSCATAPGCAAECAPPAKTSSSVSAAPCICDRDMGSRFGDAIDFNGYWL